MLDMCMSPQTVKSCIIPYFSASFSTFLIKSFINSLLSFSLYSGLDFINITPGFVVFEKNAKVNESGLKGYYADVELRNFSNKKAELFYVNSEVTYSSK